MKLRFAHAHRRAESSDRPGDTRPGRDHAQAELTRRRTVPTPAFPAWAFFRPSHPPPVSRAYHDRMICRRSIAVLLVALATAQSFAGVCATCRALPNVRLAVAGSTAAIQSGQRLAAAASDCEFQAVCSLASLSFAPASEIDSTAHRATTLLPDHPQRWSSRTIKPPLHPPKRAA